MSTKIELIRNEDAGHQTVLELKSVNELFNDLVVTVNKGSRRTTKTVEDGDDKVTVGNGFIVFNEKAEGFGVKIENAIKSFLGAMNYGTVDDFAFDVEAEFYTPLSNKSNVDKDNPFAGDKAEELIALRDRIQSEAEAAEEDEAGAQLHWLQVSIAVDQAFALCGTSKKVERWATGEGAGDNVSKAPWLESLGKAPHALREARYMAQLNEAQFAHLAAPINRGKAIELEIRKGSEDWINGGAAALASNVEYFEHPAEEDRELVSPESFEYALKGAIDAVGVERDYDAVAEGIELCREVSLKKQKAAEAAGITKHSAEDGARDVLREIVALEALIQWLEEAEKAREHVIYVENNSSDETYKKSITKALRAYTGSSMYRKVTNAMSKQEQKAANEKRVEGAKKAAEGAEAFQGAKKALELNARELAAKLYATMKDHPAYYAAFEELSIMVKAQKNREDAAARAAAAAEKDAA